VARGRFKGWLGSRGAPRGPRLFYASDIHGTEVLWRKFLRAREFYGAQGLIMGGDVTGKVAVPVVERNGGWTTHVFDRELRAAGAEELEALERRIRGNGMYPFRTTRAEVERIASLSETEREEWFEQVILRTFAGWLELAEKRLEPDPCPCFVMPGNDDPDALNGLIDAARLVSGCDDRLVELHGLTMLSLGYSNRTPWNSPRELDEEELYRRIAALADQIDDPGRAIFNIHVPPHDSGLDTAAELDADFNVVLAGTEPNLIPVGSTAVRAALERYQPLLSLHGHVHESAGATRIGRTLAVNPGSDYHTGRISGCLVTVLDDGVRHQFVAG